MSNIPNNNINAELPTILDLPTEILEIIFSHLQFEDRMSASLVCRRWSGTAIPWNEIHLKLAYCWDNSVYETFLASDRPYRHLELHDDRFTAKLITKFRDSLETLKVELVKTWSWMEALCGLPRLQWLYMKCPYTRASPNVASRRPCRSMRSLAIDEIDSSDFAFLNAFISEAFPGLTSLSLTDFVGNLHVNGLPNLETLEVIGTGVFDDRLLQDLKALPKLRDIKFSGRELEFNNHAESLTIDQIQKVEFRTSVRIDDDQLLQLTKVFPAMDSLIIGYINICTGAGVEAAKMRHPKCTFQIYGRLGPNSSAKDSWSDLESTDVDTDSS